MKKDNNDLLNSDQTLKAYDTIAPFYDEYSSKKTNYLDSIDQLVCNKIKKTDRVLDIGAGNGRRLQKIIKDIGIIDPIAIEPSTGMANLCEKNLNIKVFRSFAEDIDKINIGKFNVIIALWNVFGHIQNSNARLKALKNIYNKLEDNGKFILDVNNRHNSTSYGFINVLKRRVLDFIHFDETRGDATYDWKIKDQSFKSSGHLFTPKEIESLISQAQLKIIQRLTVDYQTGEVSNSKFKGQLFYILEKKG